MGLGAGSPHVTTTVELVKSTAAAILLGRVDGWPKNRRITVRNNKEKKCKEKRKEKRKKEKKREMKRENKMK